MNFIKSAVNILNKSIDDLIKEELNSHRIEAKILSELYFSIDGSLAFMKAQKAAKLIQIKIAEKVTVS